MKKVISLLFFIFVVLSLKAQYNITTNFGGPQTLMKNPNYGGVQGGLIPYSFSDTTSANTALTFLKTYNGALIYSTGDSALYFRANNASKWIQVLPAGGTTGIGAWTIGGNTSPILVDANNNAAFGTSSSGIGVLFKTSGTTRFVLPQNGVLDNSAASVKYLGVDTSTSQRKLVFAPATSLANEWHITGNSGTSAGSNFLGTTDDIDFVLKRNGVQSGRLSTTNTSFGNLSFRQAASGVQNSVFGAEAMTSLTSGNNNSSFGYVNSAALTSGSANSSYGAVSLNANTSGSTNSAFGVSSLSFNLTGSNNSAFGNASLGSNTTGSNNLGLGIYAGSHNTTQSNRLYISSIDTFTNILSDTTKAIIYGVQASQATSQQLYFNSQVYLPYANSGAGTKAVRINPGTGLLTYADTTTSNPGTVTSVGFTAPTSLFTVSGSPITSSGTIAATLTSATGGTVWGRTSTVTGIPAYTTNPILGVVGTSGTIGLRGTTSGTVTLSAADVAGTNTFKLPPSQTAAGIWYDAAGDGILTETTLSGVGIVSGSGTLNYVPKWTPNGTTLGNSQIFDNGTNVGINNASPAFGLDLLSAYAAGGANAQIMGAANLSYLKFNTTTGAAGGGVGFRMFFNSSEKFQFTYDQASNTNVLLGIANIPLDFWTNTTQKMRLNASGNFSIGNTNDTYKLDVTGTANISSNATVGGTLGVTGLINASAGINFPLGSGTNRDLKVYNTNSGVDNLAAVGFYPSSGTNAGTAFQFIPKGTGYDATRKAQMSFFNTDFIADASNFEVMVVKSGGTDGYSFGSVKAGAGVVRPIYLDATGTASQATANLLLNIDGSTTTKAITASGLITGSAGVTSNGNFTATGTVSLTDGANKSVGVSGAMTAGTITISNTRVTANSRIFLTPVGAGAGSISVGTIVAGTSFVINSSDGADVRAVSWLIIN